VPSDFTSRARLRAAAVAASTVLVLAPAASSAATGHRAPPPRQALLQARSQIQTLISPASTSPVKRAEIRAAGALTRATAATLWISPAEIVAPPYGASVFGDSADALADLRGVRALGVAGGAIVAADRALTQDVIAEAHGGNSTDLAAARRDLGRGDREAAAGRRPAAVRSYATAWEDAFSALTGLVVAQITALPQSAVADAAENALGSKQIGLAGPVIEHGQPPLTAGGKPEVFFAGSEACPFCGVQRWGMIVALAQFGTFSNLHLIQSTALEPPPVQGFTFFGSSYQSPYVAFVPVEVFSNVPAKIGFRHLAHPTPAENALIQRYDQGAQVPFIDVDNRFITVQSTVQPQLVAGRRWTQIGGLLRDPASIPAQAVAGEAEVLTAEVCDATGGNPSSICSQQVVHDYEAALPLLNGNGGGCPASAADAALRRGGQGPAADAALRRGGQGPVATAAHCHTG
jgi:Domain of unknown function (DUF929)